MLDRRNTLALLAASAAASLPEAGLGRSGGGSLCFLHGVASGDPAVDGAVIWTRTTPSGATDRIKLAWEVRELVTARVVRTGTVHATAARDFTAKVEVSGLHPGTEYSYCFISDAGARSRQGRFRTLPVGRTDTLDLAFACCQLYQGGYFNAFAAIAAMERLDAVVHLGDYIYEYGADYPVYGGAVADRQPEPPHETVTLADYRARHAQAKRDPELQAAHARAAFICVWDDHELANNAWIGGAANHQPEREGPWVERKAAALQAWFEWMPIREARAPLPQALFRAFRFGDLASLIMLETRLLARGSLPAELKEGTTAEEVARGLKELEAPGRDLLGAEQRRWLSKALSSSVGEGQPWQLLCSQVVMAPVAGPDVSALLGDAAAATLASKLAPGLREELQNRIALYRLRVPFNLDSWDGFPAARAELYRLFQRSGALPLVVSGDSHAFWANNLRDATGELVGRELGVTAVSSPSYGDALPGVPLGKLLAAQNPHVLFSDQAAKGFLKLHLQRGNATAELVKLSDTKSKSFNVKSLPRFSMEPRTPLRALERRSRHFHPESVIVKPGASPQTQDKKARAEL